jgi:subtilisin-like proprotein convertase family protein
MCLTGRLKIVLPFSKTQNVNYIEHVEALVNIEYPRRGNLEVVLESPSGYFSIPKILII